MDLPTKKSLAPTTFQNFSLSGSIIYYITMKPSSAKVYKKLQKTCKYFFAKNPIIIAANLELLYNGKFKLEIEHPDGLQNLNTKDVFSFPFKIWLTNKLDVCNKVDIIKLFQEKFYSFQTKKLFFCDQDINLNELLMLASSPCVDYIYFSKVNILYSDDSIVPVEKVFELFPKLKELIFHGNGQSLVTPETVKKLLENPNFRKIQTFSLGPISEVFDFMKFSNFMKQNKTLNFFLNFCDPISENYKYQLNEFTKWVINLAKSDESYSPPFIDFPGQNLELVKLRIKYIERFRK